MKLKKIILLESIENQQWQHILTYNKSTISRVAEQLFLKFGFGTLSLSLRHTSPYTCGKRSDAWNTTQMDHQPYHGEVVKHFKNISHATLLNCDYREYDEEEASYTTYNSTFGIVGLIYWADYLNYNSANFWACNHFSLFPNNPRKCQLSLCLCPDYVVDIYGRPPSNKLKIYVWRGKSWWRELGSTN